MIKILVYSMSSIIGGKELFIMNFCRNINQNLISFDFLCYDENCAFEDEIKEMGGEVFKLCPPSKNPAKFYQDTKRFLSQNAGNYDILWYNCGTVHNMTYIKLSQKYGISKIVIHSHCSDKMNSGYSDKLRRLLHLHNRNKIDKYATDFWACSAAAGEWMFPNRIIDNKEYKVIHNAIDVNRYIFNEQVRHVYRNKLDIVDKFVVGHVGRFHPEKNHDFLLEVFNCIYAKNSNSVLLLIGAGETEEIIHRRAVELGLAHAVKFLGFREDIPEFLQAIDSFVFPSLFEGLGIALIEAQAAGLPCFASENSVPHEAKVTDLLRFINLNKSADVWADTILSFKATRKNTYDEIVNANYDIRTEAKEVENFFLTMAKGR